MVLGRMHPGIGCEAQHHLGAGDSDVVGPRLAEMREPGAATGARECGEPRCRRSAVHVHAQVGSQRSHPLQQLGLGGYSRSGRNPQDAVDVGLALKQVREPLVHRPVDAGARSVRRSRANAGVARTVSPSDRSLTRTTEASGPSRARMESPTRRPQAARASATLSRKSRAAVFIRPNSPWASHRWLTRSDPTATALAPAREEFRRVLQVHPACRHQQDLGQGCFQSLDVLGTAQCTHGKHLHQRSPCVPSRHDLGRREGARDHALGIAVAYLDGVRVQRRSDAELRPRQHAVPGCRRVENRSRAEHQSVAEAITRRLQCLEGARDRHSDF